MNTYGSSYNNGHKNPIIYVAPTSFAYPTDANTHLGVMDYDPEYLEYIMPPLHDIEALQAPPLVGTVPGELVLPERLESVDNFNRVYTKRFRDENEKNIQNAKSAALEDMALRRLAQQETFAGNPDGENNQKLRRKRIMESIRKQNMSGTPVIIETDGEFYDNSSIFIDEYGLPVMVRNPEVVMI